MNLNGKEYFYIRNVQNDVIGLHDSTGKVVVNYSYDTWGNIVSITGSLKDSVGKKNPYRYRGYRYDEETGLYYLQSRYYNAEWGRFINADNNVGAIGTILSQNAFIYCMNNPVNMYDPSGHWPKILKKAVKKVKSVVSKAVSIVKSAAKAVKKTVVSAVKSVATGVQQWANDKKIMQSWNNFSSNGGTTSISLNGSASFIAKVGGSIDLSWDKGGGFMISHTESVGGGLIPSADLSVSFTQTGAPTIKNLEGLGSSLSVDTPIGGIGGVIVPDSRNKTNYYGVSYSLGLKAKSPISVNGLGSGDVGNTNVIYEGNIYEIISSGCDSVIRWCE